MKKKAEAQLVIIHFQPLELYPPVLNLLKYLSGKKDLKVVVVTTRNKQGDRFNQLDNLSGNIEIKRTAPIIAGSILRIFNYSSFYIYSFFLLLKHQPKAILYFETLSSWPALMYQQCKGEKIKLFAHYHEYLNPNEYENNMRLVKWMHGIESKMYPASYSWISHTNEPRMEKFISDQQLEKVDQNIFHIMPNYPSRNWAKKMNKLQSTGKVRLVYVGSLGFNTMYLKETVDWVQLNCRSLSLDIYSHNIDEDAHSFLQSVQNENIKIHGACNYDRLPDVLHNYDVGLVMYKPVSDNWIYNAPNKVFEYLACGLDVWFSKSMTYMMGLSSANAYPKILPIDFEKLDEFNFKRAVNREGLLFKENNFYYENVYNEMYESLNQ